MARSPSAFLFHLIFDEIAVTLTVILWKSAIWCANFTQLVGAFGSMRRSA
jgi:hypothetical protein